MAGTQIAGAQIAGAPIASTQRTRARASERARAAAARGLREIVDVRAAGGEDRARRQIGGGLGHLARLTAAARGSTQAAAAAA